MRINNKERIKKMLELCKMTLQDNEKISFVDHETRFIYLHTYYKKGMWKVREMVFPREYLKLNGTPDKERILKIGGN